MNEEPREATAHERVWRELRARLMHGAYDPGTGLTLRGLADALGVSMTPAREAVRRLVAERGLELTASGRILVPDPGPDALAELFAARRLLEPEIARRAASAATPALVEEAAAADRTLEASVAARDAEGYVRANTAFHAAIYRAAAAPALLALVESVWLQTGPSMRRLYARIESAGPEDHHGAALEALAARDAPALARAMRADIDQGARLVAAAA